MAASSSGKHTPDPSLQSNTGLLCKRHLLFLGCDLRREAVRQSRLLLCHAGRLGLVALGNDTLSRPTATSFQVNQAASHMLHLLSLWGFFYYNVPQTVENEGVMSKAETDTLAG